MLTAAVRDERTGEIVGVLVAKPKDFATGSRGYHGQGKIEIDGKRYQAQLQMVEIGSKSESGKADDGR